MLSQDLVHIDPSALSSWDRAVPRYTSYPTAPQFYPMQEGLYRERLALLCKERKPLSVYVHIPFCKTMCLFCGCSVVLNRRPEKQTEYLDLLVQEIAQLPFQEKQEILQLHLGGGTPTSLSLGEMQKLFEALKTRFFWGPLAEISIEVDPRTVYADQGEKLKGLKQMGFNRISFGVQDLDPLVQEAVKRRQSEEMTVSTYAMARQLGFVGINLDLIYGLPLQTPERFARTAERIAALKPDRIALFSYAKVPWLKKHQKAIPEASLPSTEEKFAMYTETRARFMQSGYTAIGMDHFALENDSLSIAYREKKLTRNFQGYAALLADDMIGLGVTSIGFIENGYFQNSRTIEEYRQAILAKRLPVARGYLLGDEDNRRRWVIQSIMCQFGCDKRAFERQFAIPFDAHFANEKKALGAFALQGFLIDGPEALELTPLGRLFVRLVAACFDAYFHKGHYSRAI